MLLFGPEKHGAGSGVQGRVRRAGRARHAAGELGEALGRYLRQGRRGRPRPPPLPGRPHLDTYLEVGTRRAPFTPTPRSRSRAARPTSTPAAPSCAPRATSRWWAEDRTIKARLTDVKLVMRDTLVGETATVTI
ncbi:DUF6004 family protein [Streptomyces sp. NPDC101115]|uniref:DUF6004 family protein n=1 Tax=Streptomyces sp. NPDC101115 TaxID=3366106 RepID=UPI0037F2290E